MVNYWTGRQEEPICTLNNNNDNNNNNNNNINKIETTHTVLGDKRNLYSLQE